MKPTEHRLIHAFESLSLDPSEWTHRTHVSIAFLYLREHGFDGALERIRQGIKAYNAHHAVEESATSGYNETTTTALLTLIDTVMRAYGEILPASNADEFCECHPELMSKHILRCFYTPERRMHPEAKVRFIEPDLAPLPSYPTNRKSTDRATAD